MVSRKWLVAAQAVCLLLLVACQQNKSNSGDSPEQRIQVAQDSYNRCISNIALQLLCDSARPSGNIKVMSVQEFSGGGTVNAINANYPYSGYNVGLTNNNASRNYNYFNVYIRSLSDSDLNSLIGEWNYIAQNGTSRTQSLNPLRTYPGYSYPGYYPGVY